MTLNAREMLRLLLRDRLAVAGLLVLLGFIVLAVFADSIAPFDPMAMQRVDGRIARMHPPSQQFLFGTTDYGRDIFSQVVMGSRIALQVGILAALVVTIAGTAIGLVAGYYGGLVDTILMRVVDIAYGIPFIPFVIVLVALMEPSTTNIIVAISVLSWRSVARIVRAQVLSLANRPFVKAARVAGASDLRIMWVHILPNIIPLALLEMSFVTGWAITSEASISFVGFGDPRSVSWGKTLHEAFLAGAVRTAPWWVAAPGLAIVLLVLAIFFITRGLENVINPRLREW